MTMRFGRATRWLALAITAFAVALAGATVVASPALAVSGWSGVDPYGSGCANGAAYLHETPVYDGSTLVGTGYLRYSYACQTNWSEFYYAGGAGGYACNNYAVEPSAWENNTTGTDQYSPNLWACSPVYSLMVDGRSTACAGAQIYHYPSHAWIEWSFFGCA